MNVILFVAVTILAVVSSEPIGDRRTRDVKDILTDGSSDERNSSQSLNENESEDYDQNNGLDAVPGVPGKDYPNFNFIPKTSFTCSDKKPGGYYADIETRCQVFHVCNVGDVKSSFLCPPGSIFNQKYLVCDWWYDFECEHATDLFSFKETVNRERTETNFNNEDNQFFTNNENSQFNSRQQFSSYQENNSVNDATDLSLAGTGEGGLGYSRNKSSRQFEKSSNSQKSSNQFEQSQNLTKQSPTISTSVNNGNNHFPQSRENFNEQRSRNQVSFRNYQNFDKENSNENSNKNFNNENRNFNNENRNFNNGNRNFNSENRRNHQNENYNYQQSGNENNNQNYQYENSRRNQNENYHQNNGNNERNYQNVKSNSQRTKVDYHSNENKNVDNKDGLSDLVPRGFAVNYGKNANAKNQIPVNNKQNHPESKTIFTTPSIINYLRKDESNFQSEEIYTNPYESTENLRNQESEVQQEDETIFTIDEEDAFERQRQSEVDNTILNKKFNNNFENTDEFNFDYDTESRILSSERPPVFENNNNYNNDNNNNFNNDNNNNFNSDKNNYKNDNNNNNNNKNNNYNDRSNNYNNKNENYNYYDEKSNSHFSSNVNLKTEENSANKYRTASTNGGNSHRTINDRKLDNNLRPPLPPNFSTGNSNLKGIANKETAHNSGIIPNSEDNGFFSLGTQTSTTALRSFSQINEFPSSDNDNNNNNKNNKNNNSRLTNDKKTQFRSSQNDDDNNQPENAYDFNAQSNYGTFSNYENTNQSQTKEY